MKKIKVLIVAGAMNMGGLENQLMHLLRKADKDKFQIDFITTVDHPYYQDEMEKLGAKCIRIPNTDGWHFLRYCKALYSVIKSGSYDIVHSHELFHSGIVLLTAKLAKVKHRFVHAHSWSDSNGTDTKRSFVRTVYNAVMRFLICRLSTTQIACSTLAGRFLYGDKILYKKSYHLIFNSVDTSAFLEHYYDTPSGEFCGDGEWQNVLSVGRIDAVKNHEFLIRIADVLKQRGDKIRILCAGSGEDDFVNNLKKEVKQRRLEEYIKFLGVRKDIDVLMRKASALVLPSKYEGMPLVLIEAQALGLPCVAADTFSHEVDFKIGCVEWLNLDEGEAVWADTLEKAVTKVRAPKTAVEDAINKFGFDSKIFAKKICDLYEESYKSGR